MKRMIYLAKYMLNLILTKIAPNRYARKQLGYMGESVIFYGMKPSMFGSEPWIISIGSGTEISANCQFITHDGSVNVLRDRIPDLELVEPVKIGEHCFIGINVTIIGKTVIGDGCIVGACSLVKGEFPDNCVIAGVPAKVICSVDDYIKKASTKSTHTGNLRGKEREEALKRVRKYL